MNKFYLHHWDCISYSRIELCADNKANLDVNSGAFASKNQQQKQFNMPCCSQTEMTNPHTLMQSPIAMWKLNQCDIQ